MKWQFTDITQQKCLKTIQESLYKSQLPKFPEITSRKIKHGKSHIHKGRKDSKQIVIYLKGGVQSQYKESHITLLWGTKEDLN